MRHGRDEKRQMISYGMKLPNQDKIRTFGEKKNLQIIGDTSEESVLLFARSWWENN